MEVDQRQNLRDDRVNNCHSFGSNYHPSSQSRKISIGMTVDLLTKKKSKATKEAEVEISNAEGKIFNRENYSEPKYKGECTTNSANKGKQIDGTEQVSSPWITTRSPHQKEPTLENVQRTKQSRPAAGGRQKKLNGEKDKQRTYSDQFFATENTKLQTGVGSQKKFGGITYSRKIGKDGDTEFVEDFTFATAQVTSSDKAVIPDKMDKPDNGRSETLRMKLWEILGNVSSPKSQNSNPKSSEVRVDKLKPMEGFNQTGDAVPKPRHNSDSIETDSEGPNQTTMRPLTRSLTRKRASTKVQQNNTKIGSCSTYKQRGEKKNIFTFQEGWSGKLNGDIKFGSSMPTRKKSQRKGSAIEPRKIWFSEMDNADGPQGASYTRESPPQPGHEMENFHGCPLEDGINKFEAKNSIQEKDCQSPQLKTINQTGVFDNPTLVENRNQQEDCNHPSLKNAFDPLHEIQSPTLAFKTPTLSPSPCSSPRTVQMEQDCTPGPNETRFIVGNFRSFRSWHTPKSDCSGTDAETEPTDDAEELKDSSSIEPLPAKEKKDAENSLLESPYEDGDPRSSREDSPIIKRYDYQREISPESGTGNDQNNVHHPTKRLRSSGGVKVIGFGPSLTSPQGTMDSDMVQEQTVQNQDDDCLQEPTEQNQEDDLTRFVTLLALALDNFKKKMDSVTRKKSSEILMTVSEEIHLQLKNVESQIQTDIGKLTSLSKSKRKRLETRFEEQQEQLKLIHEKFKKDIYHHLQDCSSILEVMEAHQIELKRTVKKQRSSHQKLLLQLEEAVETQLNDAQRRITTVHESAREKMRQLKHVIAECLKGGILS